jgi:hypothetical protein
MEKFETLKWAIDNGCTFNKSVAIAYATTYNQTEIIAWLKSDSCL